MIAHSGFTRTPISDQVAADIIALQTKAKLTGGHVPEGLPGWLAEQCHPITPQEQAWQSGLMSKKDHLDAMDAAKFNLGHSLGAPLPGFSDPGHAPAPAAPAHLVPMAMHLDHLQITAKAERSFGFKLGFFAGMLLTLIGTYLHYRHG